MLLSSLETRTNHGEKISEMDARNYHEIWLAAIILVIISQSKLLTAQEHQFCPIDRSCNNLVTLNCSLLNLNEIYSPKGLSLGGNVTTPLEAIYMAPINLTGFLTVNIQYLALQEHPSLKRIIIRRNAILEVQVHHFRTIYFTIVRRTIETLFEKLPNLEYLEVSSSFFEEIQFTLPENLKTYNISGNLYTSLIINGSSKLDDLDASNNTLTSFPSFTYDNRTTLPLKKLRLKKCLLEDMTVEKLAPFCILELLELEFPQGNRFYPNNRTGYCNCTILKQWADEASIVIDSLVCYQPKADEKIECPIEEYLERARKIRADHGCPPFEKKPSTALPAPATTPAPTGPLMYIVLFILFSVVFLALIFFVIRRFYLTDSVTENTSDAPSSAIPTEEEEDSLPESGSEEGSPSQ